jgi:hypothetical protein
MPARLIGLLLSEKALSCHNSVLINIVKVRVRLLPTGMMLVLLVAVSEWEKGPLGIIPVVGLWPSS